MIELHSVNNVAVQTLKIVFPLMFDIGCFSHTLNHVGEKLKTPILDKFVSGWINIFSRSPKTKLTWKTQTDLPVPSYIQLPGGGLNGRLLSTCMMPLVMSSHF